jgi:hypothetical protein
LECFGYVCFGVINFYWLNYYKKKEPNEGIYTIKIPKATDKADPKSEIKLEFAPKSDIIILHTGIN